MPGSFDEIIATHQHMVMTYLYSIVRDRHRAEDLLQDTFVRAYRHRGQLVQMGNTASWLRTIALHLAINELRRRKLPHAVVYMEDLDGGLFGQLDPGPDGAWIDRVALLRECRERLMNRQREVLEGFYDQGESGDQVGARLGLARHAVHRILWQARKSLRDCIQKRVARQEREDQWRKM